MRQTIYSILLICVGFFGYDWYLSSQEFTEEKISLCKMWLNSQYNEDYIMGGTVYLPSKQGELIDDCLCVTAKKGIILNAPKKSKLALVYVLVEDDILSYRSETLSIVADYLTCNNFN